MNEEEYDPDAASVEENPVAEENFVTDVAPVEENPVAEENGANSANGANGANDDEENSVEENSVEENSVEENSVEENANLEGGRRRRNTRNRRNNRNNRKSRRRNRRNSRNRRNMRGGGSCGTMPNSLSQGAAFQNMTKNLHGGRRKMRGGSVPMAFPFEDSTLLQGSARSDAGVAQQDQFYRESQTSIPSDMRYSQTGGGLSPAPLTQTDMLLPRGLSEQAMNPQWHTEPRTNPEIGRMAEAEANFRSTNTTPGFNGPTNAYQTQAGGRRRRNSRKNRKASRKNRKASRKNRR